MQDRTELKFLSVPVFIEIGLQASITNAFTNPGYIILEGVQL
jgi:hypothetical protein